MVELAVANLKAAIGSRTRANDETPMAPPMTPMTPMSPFDYGNASPRFMPILGKKVATPRSMDTNSDLAETMAKKRERDETVVVNSEGYHLA